MALSEAVSPVVTSGPVLLTIAIPTYNRAEQLSKLLEQLVGEAAGLRDRISISISNNASTDHTEETLTAFASRHPDLPLDIQTQRTNIGPVPNVHFLVQRAAGNWVWCLGDDDLLVPGALARVIRVLETYDCDALLVRTTGIVEWDEIQRDSEAGDDEVRKVVVRTPEGARYLFAATFVASVLLRRDVWSRVIPETSRFQAPNYLTWVAFLLVAARSNAIGVLDKPCVAGNATMVGEMRFPVYGVAIAQRLHVWRDLPYETIGQVMRPLMIRLFVVGWRRVVADRCELQTAREKLAAFRTGTAILGWGAMRALPLLAIALLVPSAVRRHLVALRRKMAARRRA